MFGTADVQSTPPGSSGPCSGRGPINRPRFPWRRTVGLCGSVMAPVRLPAHCGITLVSRLWETSGHHRGPGRRVPRSPWPVGARLAVPHREVEQNRRSSPGTSGSSTGGAARRAHADARRCHRRSEWFTPNTLPRKKPVAQFEFDSSPAAALDSNRSTIFCCWHAHSVNPG